VAEDLGRQPVDDRTDARRLVARGQHEDHGAVTEGCRRPVGAGAEAQTHRAQSIAGAPPFGGRRGITCPTSSHPTARDVRGTTPRWTVAMRWFRKAASTGVATPRPGSGVWETARSCATVPMLGALGTTAQATVVETIHVEHRRREPHRPSRVPPAPAMAEPLDRMRSAAVADCRRFPLCCTGSTTSPTA
jgi:hypothetical protein